MVKTLDFLSYTNQDLSVKRSIADAMASQMESELIIDIYRLTFHPNTQYVVVDKASADVPFATKIVKCKLPYATLSKLLDGQWGGLTGIEWL